MWLLTYSKSQPHIDGLVQDGSNSSALAMDLLHSCAKPSICLCRYVAYIKRQVHTWNGHTGEWKMHKRAPSAFKLLQISDGGQQYCKLAISMPWKYMHALALIEQRGRRKPNPKNIFCFSWQYPTLFSIPLNNPFVSMAKLFWYFIWYCSGH